MNSYKSTKIAIVSVLLLFPFLPAQIYALDGRDNAPKTSSAEGAYMTGGQSVIDSSGVDLQSVRKFSLQGCIDYAVENNIQLKQNKNNYLSGIEDTKMAKAAMFPSLVASTQQSYINYPSENAASNNSYTGTYGLNAGLSIYNGGKLRTALKQQKVQNSIDSLYVLENINDIKIAIVQAYMQCLYAQESIAVNKNSAESSKAQRDRGYEMWQAGSISKVDYAQLQSQYTSDEYQVVAAQTAFDDYKLQLKQLLELDITEEIELDIPQISKEEVLWEIPSKETLYYAALDYMPQIKSGELSVTAASLAVKEAKAGFLPTVSLSASVGTGHSSGPYNVSGSRVWNNFNENVGISVSVPIFSNRSNKTALNKARIAEENSLLAEQTVKKELLKEVEAAYLDAVSAQSQFVAAEEKEKYARESYDLVNEQFILGMSNIVELITAKNDLTNAKQEVLQSKYMALLSKHLLNIYQGLPVE